MFYYVLTKRFYKGVLLHPDKTDSTVSWQTGFTVSWQILLCLDKEALLCLDMFYSVLTKKLYYVMTQWFHCVNRDSVTKCVFIKSVFKHCCLWQRGSTISWQRVSTMSWQRDVDKQPLWQTCLDKNRNVLLGLGSEGFTVSNEALWHMCLDKERVASVKTKVLPFLDQEVL